MSHIVTNDGAVQITGSIETLRRAVEKRLEFVFLENQRSYKWYGHWVGDTPMPEGLTEDMLGKCEHAIRIPGAEYEVGIVQTPAGGWELRWDYWQAGGLTEELGGQITQAWATERAIAEAYNEGHTVRETLMADGSIKLELSEMEYMGGGEGW